ncbi:hypothetical protein D917_09543 [Trichinella nativa]|uniref:Uncharacterized protein n=1 Tax=Trichinella nativa TaxID=6335 RepID=A0A1Y3EKX7_9BILA|nr:hypothetical protein D917_09543 [Trichinella nativa]
MLVRAVGLPSNQKTSSMKVRRISKINTKQLYAVPMCPLLLISKAQSSSGSSPQNMPHQRNIPIEVINAMLECQDPSQLGPLSKLLESFTFNGPEPLAWQIFQNQSSGSSDGLTHCQQPGSTTDSSIKLSCTPTTVGRADSSLNNGLERKGNFTPTSVMKQRQQQQQADKSVDSHAAGVLDEQNPLPSGAQYRPITKQSTVCCSPSTSASARDGQASPLLPLVMPPMGTSGSAGHSPLSPQEVARRMQQKRYIHEQMLKHAVYQQQQQQSFGVITPTLPANAVLMNIMRGSFFCILFVFPAFVLLLLFGWGICVTDLFNNEYDPAHLYCF